MWEISIQKIILIIKLSHLGSCHINKARKYVISRWHLNAEEETTRRWNLWKGSKSFDIMWQNKELFYPDGQQTALLFQSFKLLKYFTSQLFNQQIRPDLIGGWSALSPEAQPPEPSKYTEGPLKYLQQRNLLSGINVRITDCLALWC